MGSEVSLGDDIYEVLKSESVMLIGEKHPSRVVWQQLYTTVKMEEGDLRQLMIALNEHITKGRAPSGSARKFLDGKLIYLENSTGFRDRVYAIFTNQVDNIYSDVKNAVGAVASRGGVYSAQRFFTEAMDILDDPEKLQIYTSLTEDEALKKLNDEDLEEMDFNELGIMIAHLNQSKNLDMLTLEKIYLHIYQRIQALAVSMTDGHLVDDPDEFLDASYSVALRYQESESFHLALELYKLIIPVAQSNNRLDLEAASRIQIATIYKRYFPSSAEYILDILDQINEAHLDQTNNRLMEVYYCLLGYAYNEQKDDNRAQANYQLALNVADQDISSPVWIAEAYNYLGRVDFSKHYLKDATRHYLTAASIAFSSGELSKADDYRHSAAITEMEIANSIIHTSIILRMEQSHKDAEYRAWEGLRYLTKAYIHCLPDQYSVFRVMTEEILMYARAILSLPGKQITNKHILDQLDEVLTSLYMEVYEFGKEQEKLQEVSKLIEENIPLAPPTFMLLTLDGRLMTMGMIDDDGWQRSDIEGTLLSGVLSAVMSLMSEVTEEQTSLRTIDAGNFQVMIEQTENLMTVLLVDRDIKEFRRRLIQMMEYIDETLGEQLKYWDGNLAIFDAVAQKATTLLAPSVVAANLDS